MAHILLEHFDCFFFLLRVNVQWSQDFGYNSPVKMSDPEDQSGAKVAQELGKLLEKMRPIKFQPGFVSLKPMNLHEPRTEGGLSW